ncbi:hypothetical protein MKW92_019313 [Papaver armeniacum]|nr:hypothetical protein MKW92_045256 [Papaver armeniacum]KAI3892248.1 hypothetical protein MKW92_046405 [Papaver armeniacum]KAI3967149.1 hypothetical protein MKW92_019313 [Papaver armeniacum]
MSTLNLINSSTSSALVSRTSLSSSSSNFTCNTKLSTNSIILPLPNRRATFPGGKIRAVGSVTEAVESEETTSTEEPPSIDFAFVNSVLLPDGSLDIHTRSACGGQKLRDIMLDTNIELYGPNARPLLNCGGGGTCGTCIVEVVQGKELLSLRTDKEKEILYKKPKTWRLACQTTVGKPDSRGEVVIQQLPEWKAHEWSYER